MVALSDAGTMFGEIAVGDVEPEAYRRILQAWRDQCGTARFPAVEKIDPFLVPNLAANLLLLEVTGETLTYRLLGDKVVTAVGTGLKGKTLREVYGDTDYVRIIERQLLECVASCRPLYSCHDFQLRDDGYGDTRQHRKAWRIALPYGDGERVTRLLCYQLFSQNIEISFRKDIDFESLMPKTVFKVEI